MDLVMTELAAALPVDIMPGPDDPANVSLPQQPLHQCLFPGAAPYSSFRRVTNPHAFELGGCLVLGTAGQNVDDMAKYTRGKSRCVCLLQVRQRLLLHSWSGVGYGVFLGTPQIYSVLLVSACILAAADETALAQLVRSCVCCAEWLLCRIGCCQRAALQDR
jgi:hypothetical protein